MAHGRLRIYGNGDRGWWLDGEYHREGGPALEGNNGHKGWRIYGKSHREGGPAIEYADGRKSWYCIR